MQDCTYRNSSDKMVILRCCGNDAFFLERVVFPFEILAFRCPPMSDVNIWTHALNGPELVESFSSDRLVADGGKESPDPAVQGMFPPESNALQTTPWLRAC